MKKIGELFQESDWKTEKHVPLIECAEDVKYDELFKITVAIGKEISHPNTTEHHISWISLFFLPEGEKFPYHIAKYEFGSHGSSVQGSNTSSVYTHHVATGWMKTSKGGTLFACSLCNIHGLWQSSKEIKVR